MSYAYAQKKRTPAQTGTRSGGGAMENAVPNSARLAALESGQITPTAADKGHRVDLPEAMRAKMESSFGMDFSGVKLYESAMLGQTGAEAMAQGNEIAFAPGKLDFASMEGQARLGHELSHVASQARGEVHGNGFLADSGLEARADREGAMAARGESVYGGAVAPLSAASAAPMAGPMQAKKPMEQRQSVIDRLTKEYGGADNQNYKGTKMEGNVSNPGNQTEVRGMTYARMIPEFAGSLGEDMSEDEIAALYGKLMAPHLKSVNLSDPKDQEAVNKTFDSGMMQLKEQQYKQLKKLEKTYGRMGSEMHPEDFMKQHGDKFIEMSGLVQDTAQMMDEGGGRYFDFENNKEDQEYKQLAEYYRSVAQMMTDYKAFKSMEKDTGSKDPGSFQGMDAYVDPELEATIGGPSMDQKAKTNYKKDLKKRAKKGGFAHRLFGKFL